MTEHDLDLIERFIAAYNALDAHLQSTLATGSGHQSFRSLVDTFAKRNAWFRDADALRTYAQVRNVLVHEKTEAYEYVCVPSQRVVERIEAIRDRLLHPQTVARFEREVETLTLDTKVATALRLIRQKGFSQFPVCQGGQFRGVLTENSITRWLSEQVYRHAPVVDLESAEVADVLKFTGKRPNFEFVARDAGIEEIAYLFHENTWLEVVLVTSHGKPHEALRGILTRGDISRFESGYS